MGEAVLETHSLSKKYNTSFALKDCSITIERGQIYGLVGKNGAGKTTLMRLICGQSGATSGTLALFGKSDGRALVESRTRIGCMIETPAFYPNLSAKKNLKIYCMKKGIPETGQINEILQFVGLTEAGRKHFSQFSLGMKQRLGLALALLGNPEFLVLDEPTNGLDPIGIAEMRDMIVKLNREKNVTVLLSSHILKEMSMMATHYGFIDRGRVLAQLSAVELMNRCQEAIRLKVSETERACAVLEQFCGCSNYRVLTEGEILCYDNVEHPEQLNRELVENGVEVYALTNEGRDLEKFFIDLVRGGTAHA